MGKHWQIGGPRGEDPAVTDAREGTRGACPAGMVSVSGKMKVHAMIDELQLQILPGPGRSLPEIQI